MRKSKYKVGDLVICKVRQEAYYSNYGGNPEQWFEEGMLGIVASKERPSTIREGVYFICVDFRGKPKAKNNAYDWWRCAVLDNNHIRLAKDSEVEVADLAEAWCIREGYTLQAQDGSSYRSYDVPRRYTTQWHLMYSQFFDFQLFTDKEQDHE